MSCLICGKQLPEEAQFCHQCREQNLIPDDNSVPENPGKRIRKGAIAFAILGACALVLVAFAVLREKLKDRSQKPAAGAGAPLIYSASLPTPTPSPIPTPTPFWKAESYEIDTKAVGLQRDQMWWQPLLVKDGWRNARLVGSFTAQGGEKNDIEAIVTNESGLINLQKNRLHQSEVWYTSGRVTENTINAPLPAGQNYLIFDNRFSVSAHKTVRFKLRVEYERLAQP